MSGSTDDPSQFPFADDAAQLRAPAGKVITRSHLLEHAIRPTREVDRWPDEDEAYLAVARIREREPTRLERCLTQLRHVQHHLGIASEIARDRGVPPVACRGYGRAKDGR